MNGLAQLGWPQQVGDSIDQGVQEEGQRTRVARKAIPVYLSDALNVPADTVSIGASALSVDEGTVVPLIETWVEFTLTEKQVQLETSLGTAQTLARRAANLLAQAEDVIVFQGFTAGKSLPVVPAVVQVRGDSADGLLAKATVNPVVDVDPEKRSGGGGGSSGTGAGATAGVTTYGLHTFEAVTKAISELLSQGYGGGYALVLQADLYADTFAPVKDTLNTTRDLIVPLVDAGFYGTGTLPAKTGVIVSQWGDPIDLVVGTDATAAFMQESPEGLYVFRVYERFALRVMDNASIVKLNFK
jgi:uncharacterized linocin/CFP29 family protein